MLKLISEIIIPNFCISCQRPGYKVCGSCMTKLKMLDYSPCIICEGYTTNGITHKICSVQNRHSPERVIFSYAYLGIAKEIIKQSKEGKRAFGLLELLTKNLKFINDINNFKDVDFIVPIPPSVQFFNSRVLEPTIFIAGEISSLINVPVLNILSNTFYSRPQKGLSKANRFQSIKEKLNITKSYINEKDFARLTTDLLDKNFLVVDDVSTSGASIMFASYLLKSAGAKKVYGYALSKDLRFNA